MAKREYNNGVGNFSFPGEGTIWYAGKNNWAPEQACFLFLFGPPVSYSKQVETNNYIDETRGCYEGSMSWDTYWRVLVTQSADDLYRTSLHHVMLSHEAAMASEILISKKPRTTLRNHCPALSCCRSVQLKFEAFSICLSGKTFSTSVVLCRVRSCIRKGTPSTLMIRRGSRDMHSWLGRSVHLYDFL